MTRWENCTVGVSPTKTKNGGFYLAPKRLKLPFPEGFRCKYTSITRKSQKPMADFSKIERKLRELTRYVKEDLPEVMGVEAVNHFEESFQKQGFTDAGLVKWADVERRDAGSTWYGFKAGAASQRPGRRRRKANSITNFSPAATKRPILHGHTKQLKRSIAYKRNGRGGVLVYSDLPYAKIHNEGGNFKVFGKKAAVMKRRQFMGKSQVLGSNIKKAILDDLARILK